MSVLSVRNLQTGPQIAIPPGLIVPWAGGAATYGTQTTRTAPEGWLFCDGSAVSRSIYAALFAAISTTYGSGDGSTTFNLPGGSSRFIQGVSGNLSRGNASNTYSATHSHSNSISPSVSIGGAGYHDTNAINCSTDGHGFNHGGNYGQNSTGGGTSWNTGNTRVSAPGHGHPGSRNYSAHYGGAHNVTSNMNAANHSHNNPTTNAANFGSDSQGSWTPLYMDLWHIIKC